MIERCYRPVLRLAREFPIGIEATGYTLRAIKALDPAWIDELKELIDAGQVEFVGSGAAQIIGPLVSPEVTRKNLELGNKDYQSILGVTPSLALVNEQAYAPSLLPLYEGAGYKAVMMDWAEASSHHPEWPADLSARPQIVSGGGSEMPVIWSDAISFQKFQRYAHGELTADEYFEFLLLQFEKGVKALPLYTSDGEVFDYRPGRFTSEAGLKTTLEYERIYLIYKALSKSGGARLALPSEVLETLEDNTAPIRIETAAAPVTVKKQRKYNLLRWAATGRDDLLLNTHCWRMLEAIEKKGDASDDEWRFLLEAWASDFRTHITAKRWQALQQSLQPLPDQSAVGSTGLTAKVCPGAPLPSDVAVDLDGRTCRIETPTRHLVLNCYRGLAVQSFGFGSLEGYIAGAPAENAPIGTLAHGFYDDIAYGADFYSGHLVFEPHDSHKVSDLSRCNPSYHYDPETDSVVVNAEIHTGRGTIGKQVRLSVKTGRVEIEYDLGWDERHWGSLRLGHVTLNPRAFDRDSLFFESHNGGMEPDRHMLCGDGGLLTFDHAKPVSKLVSATTGVGMTADTLVIGDKRQRVTLSMKRTDAAGIGMVTMQPVKDSFFLRGLISLQETDETARLEHEPVSDVVGPARIRYAIDIERS